MVKIIADTSTLYSTEEGKQKTIELPEGAFVTTWNYPQDTRRDVVAPGGTFLRVKAQDCFDVQLVDVDGAVVSVARAEGEAILAIPQYAGDGIKSNRYELRITVYEQMGIVHRVSQIVVPPTHKDAKALLVVTGEEVRRTEQERILKSMLRGGRYRVNTIRSFPQIQILMCRRIV